MKTKKMVALDRSEQLRKLIKKKITGEKQTREFEKDGGREGNGEVPITASKNGKAMAD